GGRAGPGGAAPPPLVAGGGGQGRLDELALEFPDHVLEASIHVLQGHFAHPVYSLGSSSNPPVAPGRALRSFKLRRIPPSKGCVKNRLVTSECPRCPIPVSDL